MFFAISMGAVYRFRNRSSGQSSRVSRRKALLVEGLRFAVHVRLMLSTTYYSITRYSLSSSFAGTPGRRGSRRRSSRG